MTLETKRYVDRKTVNESYRPQSNLMSPGLKRAREPFRFRNILTGLVLGGFAVGVWAYSISAVKQDVFDDIDEEARELAKSGKTTSMASLEDETKTQSQTVVPPTPSTNGAPASAPTIVLTPDVPLPGVVTRPRGLLVKLLDARYPWLLDPKQKTLVWGAPSVDNPGRLSTRGS